MNDGPPEIPAVGNSFTPLRVVALILAVLLSIPGSRLLLAWVLDIFKRLEFDALLSSLALSVGTAAFICWWFALRGQHATSRVRVMFTLLGAGIIGGISFAAGFFGPLIFTPQANQGPLLGILFTGPLGFFAGAVIGALAGWWRTRDRR